MLFFQLLCQDLNSVSSAKRQSIHAAAGEVAMAGRNHPYSRQPHHHPSIDEPRIRPRSTAAVIEAQQREIQALLLDNQRLATSHVAVKQELAAAEKELRHLSSTAANVKAECDSRVREVYERSLKTEAELRSIDRLRAELSQVKTDIQKMTADRKEFASKLLEIAQELVSSRSQLVRLPAMEEEIQAMRQQIKRGRAAIECEKKMHATNLEQSQIMEKNMLSVAREVEKLRAELANTEKHARAAAPTPVPGYPSVYSEAIYGGNLYTDRYPMHQISGSGWC